MLFRDQRVVAVIDYDSARLLPRVIDTPNGLLHFSIIGGDDDVSKWPDYLDEARFQRFGRGYDQSMLLSQAEIKKVPYLMMEALIAEAVLPHRPDRHDRPAGGIAVFADGHAGR